MILVDRFVLKEDTDKIHYCTQNDSATRLGASAVLGADFLVDTGSDWDRNQTGYT